MNCLDLYTSSRNYLHLCKRDVTYHSTDEVLDAGGNAVRLGELVVSTHFKQCSRQLKTSLKMKA